MEGCRGAPANRYASNRESRRGEAVRQFRGEEHLELHGEISEEAHCSVLSESECSCGGDPKEKFSLNILEDVPLPGGAGSRVIV